MNYNLLKAGNVIRYNGRLDGYHGHVGKIISAREDDAFIISVKRYPNDAEHEIAAYPYDIAPVIMSVATFEQLGFTQNPQTKILTRNNVNIAAFSYIKTIKNGLGESIPHWDIKGFRLITGQLPDDLNEQGVLANSIDVNSFHALQNYYSDKIGEQLQLP